jgi:hypothetical protein
MEELWVLVGVLRIQYCGRDWLLLAREGAEEEQSCCEEIEGGSQFMSEMFSVA